ncbi:MAG: type I-E CRISPR-associated protein Cse1/CasA, partial [Thermomicrobium sp.]|nr:type I-E CRISPR-associated protein Cse1/CasA [Thermomicrobium sp.]
LWRDSLALTRTVGTSDGELEQPPRVVRWWARLARVGLLAESIIPVDVAGAIADQAKPLFWRYERFPLPLAILDDADALLWLEGFLSMAEKAVQQLASELRRLVIELGVAKEQVGRFVAASGADGAYWSALEPLFYPLLHRLAQPGADRQALCDEWLSHVRGAALDAFQLAARSVEASSRAELLTADAERRLRQALRELACRGNTIDVGNGSPEVEEVAT